MSGVCRGEGRASPLAAAPRRPGLTEGLRRVYLWIPHRSKRDLYARVLGDC